MSTPIVVVEPVIAETLDFRDWCAIYAIRRPSGRERGEKEPSQLMPSSWSGRRDEESLRLVCSRRESGTWIVKAVGEFIF